MTINTQIDITKVITTTIKTVEPATSITTMIGSISTQLGSTATVTVGTVLQTGLVGPPGPSGNEELSRLAGEVLSGGMLVYTSQDGQVYKADSNTLLKSVNLLGITKTAASVGSEVIVNVVGLVTDAAWNFTLNTPVFLGNNGQPTQEIPLDAVVTLVVGYATSTTSFVYAPQQIILI